MPATRDSNGNTICVKQFVIDNQLVNAESALKAAEAYMQHAYCGSDMPLEYRAEAPDMVEVREVGQPIQIMMTYEMKCTAEFKNEAVVGKCPECPEDEGRSWPPYGKSTGPKKPPMKPDPIPAHFEPHYSDDGK